MNLEDVKKAQNEMKEGFEAFKKANDSSIEEIKAGGKATAETLEKLEKSQADVLKLSESVAAMQKSIDRDRMVDDLNSGTSKQKTERFKKYISAEKCETATEYKKLFFTEKGEYSDEKADKYKKAFELYLLTGKETHMSEYEAKSMNVINDVAGGYLVTPIMGELITDTIAEFSPFHQHVDLMTIVANEIKFPTTNRRVGASRAHELASRAETTAPTFGERSIKPEDLYAEPRLTQRMLDVRPDMESWLSKVIADEFIITEANEIANGTGSGEGRGFLTYASGTGVDQIEQVNSGNASLIDDADKIMDLKSKLKPAYLAAAKWFANRATFNTIGQLKDGNGRYLWQPGLQQGQPMQLLGLPTVPSEDMPDIAASSLSLALADLKRGYKWVVMPGMRVIRDIYTSKPFVKLNTTKRSDGDVVINEAIKLLKTSA